MRCGAQRRSRFGAVCLLLMALLAGCSGPPNRADGLSTDQPQAALVCPAPCAVQLAHEGLEPFVAVNPRDPLHVVASSFTVDNQFGVSGRTPHFTTVGEGFVHVSTDGGSTWSTVRLPAPSPRNAADAAKPFTGWMWDLKPLVQSDGTVLVVGMAGDRVWAWGDNGQPATGPGADAGVYGYFRFQVFVARSTDGGYTFPEVVVVYEETGPGILLVGADAGPAGSWAVANGAASFLDQPWLVEGPDGTLLLKWYRQDSSPGSEAPAWCSTDPTWLPYPYIECGAGVDVFTTSRDGGQSWAAPRTVTKEGLAAPEFWGAGVPALGGDGTLYLALRGESRPLLATSRDDGASWNTLRLDEAPPHSGPFLWLKVHRDSRGDRLFLSYASPDASTGGFVPLLLVSNDGGRSWEAPLMLDTAPARGNVQPAMDVDPEGTAFVSFYRNGPGGEKDRLMVAVRDGQATEPVVLQANATRPGDRPRDYMGTAAFAGGSYAVWMGREGPHLGIMGARVLVEAATKPA